MTTPLRSIPASPDGAPPLRELVFDGVGVDLAGVNVLRDVTVTLPQRRIAVIGSNGSGKSTFARLLGGLVAPSRGRVRIHGHDLVGDRKQVLRMVGSVFSNPDAQIIMPTVAEDVAFSLRRRGLARDEIARRVTATLERYGLAERADAPAHSLSGGQKQLLALSAVLITEPALIVADEPTALLDGRNSRLISSLLLDEIPQQLVLVTHDLGLAARCDVAVRFEDGMLLEADDPAPVIARYRRDLG
jgi:biotin transport system ATP-binding protein